uniref:Major facilitator superfamily associated domain-containing protein n=1 Tax=Glossina palpalis gambiensis TaxID=67801 RepID=A0A1B0C3R4_9MUSC
MVPVICVAYYVSIFPFIALGSLAIGRILSGLIVDKSHSDYIRLEVFYLGWLTIAFVANTVIYVYGGKTKGNLNMGHKNTKHFPMWKGLINIYNRYKVFEDCCSIKPCHTRSELRQFSTQPRSNALKPSLITIYACHLTHSSWLLVILRH